MPHHTSRGDSVDRPAEQQLRGVPGWVPVSWTATHLRAEEVRRDRCDVVPTAAVSATLWQAWATRRCPPYSRYDTAAAVLKPTDSPSLMDRSHRAHIPNQLEACTQPCRAKPRKAAHKAHMGASAVSGALVMLYSALSTSTTTSATAHSDRPAPNLEAKTACGVLCPQPVLCARSTEFALQTPSTVACPQAMKSASIRSGATCPVGSNKAEESAW